MGANDAATKARQQRGTFAPVAIFILLLRFNRAPLPVINVCSFLVLYNLCLQRMHGCLRSKPRPFPSARRKGAPVQQLLLGGSVRVRQLVVPQVWYTCLNQHDAPLSQHERLQLVRLWFPQPHRGCHVGVPRRSSRTPGALLRHAPPVTKVPIHGALRTSLWMALCYWIHQRRALSCYSMLRCPGWLTTLAAFVLLNERARCIES